MALRVLEKHLNVRGIVHGGLLVTLADSALATVLHHHRGVPFSLVTVSLTTDFVEAAHLGDWIEAHVDVPEATAATASSIVARRPQAGDLTSITAIIT